jgi:ribosome-associated translation inhibitor RaiA
MRIEIRFHHMDRSEALETYVNEKLSDVIDEVLHRRDGHILVWLNADTNRTTRANPTFVCEFEVRYPPRKDIFVSRSGADMHVAINEAVDSLRGLLREDGKREVQNMRSNSAR